MRSEERSAMEHELRQALDRNELVVYYQPKVDIRTGAVSGAEALVRWNHPELGLVSPDAFIPLAEQTGLILPIGEWILRTACVQTKRWHDAGLPMSISVNLSGRQFMNDGLVDSVRRILRDTGLPPSSLSLEITESVAMDVEQIAKALEQLKQLGVFISIDDFGMGFSSLLYLKRFPLDTIKIDRSFVMDSMKDENDAVIVKTIIAMARSLKLQVIAEGVETREQLAFLQEHHCNEAQGFFFSRPVPAVELERDLERIRQVSRENGLHPAGTESIRLEEQLRSAHEDLQLTIRKQQGLTFKLIQCDNRILFSFCEGILLSRMGLSSKQVVGKDLFEILSEEQAAHIFPYYKRAWAGEPNVSFEGTLNGIPYIASLSPVLRRGKVVEVIGTCSDVTELKRIEGELRAAKEQLELMIEGIMRDLNGHKQEEKDWGQAVKALRASEAKYRLIADHMTDLIAVMDEQGMVIYASPSHEALLGYAVRQYEGRSAYDLIHPEDIPHVSQAFRYMLQEKKPIQLEFRCKHKQGNWVCVEAKGNPVRIGNSVQFIVVSREIAMRKQTEERLVKSEKLAIVGQLAAGMAHEIRNPITTLKGFYSLMKSGIIKEQYFPVIEGEFNRLETIINEFLAFAKPQAVELRQTVIGDVIEDAARFLESQTLLRNIQLVVEKEPAMPPILCDPNKVKQVFVNVIHNAMDAMPYGGDIQIEAMAHGADYVQIRIRDQGCGISSERLKRIGEPFYSTKEKGTGMGLMLCEKIVKEHLGFMEIQSELHRGTTVTIIFPKAG